MFVGAVYDRALFLESMKCAVTDRAYRWTCSYLMIGIDVNEPVGLKSRPIPVTPPEP
jgi:hypothetical protein